MRLRFTWLAFPVAALMGAALGFLHESPGEPEISFVAGAETSPLATAAIDRTTPVLTEDSSPLAATDLTQTLRQALLHTSRLHRRYELIQIAEKLTEHELQNLLQGYLDQPHASRTDKLVLAEMWAERAPEAAAAFVAGHSESYLLSQGVAKGWGRRDPTAALAWVMSRPAGRRLEFLINLQQGIFETGTPNPIEVMHAALQSYGDANIFSAGEDLGHLFAQWARHDANAAEAFARGLTNADQRQRGLLAVLSTLAETNPKKSIDFFGRMSNSEWMRGRPAPNLVAQLAKQDITLATQFAHSQPEGQARASAIASIAGVMLDDSPEKALGLIDSIPIADSAGTYAFYEELIKSDPSTALAHYTQRLEQMDPTSEVYRSLQGLFNNHLITQSPARETAEFLLSETDAARQSRLSRVLERWVGQDAVGAAAWVDALPSGITREYALTGVAEGKASRNITEAVSWLGTLPKGSDYSAAVQGFASAVFSDDPDGALAWLKTIPDPAERQRRLRSAWQYWATHRFEKADRTAAEQWRDSSPDLTPEERKGLVLPEPK